MLSLMVSTAALLSPPRVAITGSTGKLGTEAVKQLVAAGYQVRALVRPGSESKADAIGSLPGVALVSGSVTSATDCVTLVDGCSAVLSMHGARRSSKITDALPWTRPEDDDPTHSKQVNYVGVQNLIDAVKASATCQRIIRITGKGETPFSIFSILINTMGSMAKAWNYEGERLLRGSGVDYTIVRPGVMMDGVELEPKSLALADDGGELKVSKIGYPTIAALCVESLAYPNAAKCTLTAMAVPTGEGADTYAPLLQAVRADRRAFPGDELFAKNLLAVRLGGAAIVGIAAAAAAGVLNIVLRLVALVGSFLR